jgi:hypothetical protein
VPALSMTGLMGCWSADLGQIWLDGCPECEYLGQHHLQAMGNLDNDRFKKAWKRAVDWKRGDLPPHFIISDAGLPLLETLWMVQVTLERLGVPPGVILYG